MSKALDIIESFTTLKTDRRLWEDYWQDLADVLFPKRADITAGSIPGEDRHSILFDGTPMRARRGLATAIDGLIKPKTTKWFNIKAQNEDINENQEAREWMDSAEDIMWKEIYSRNARFIQRSGECDNDLVAFGTGFLFIGESQDLQSLSFRTIHPKDAVIQESSDGIVDIIYIERHLTARQAEQAYGDRIGEKTKEALKQEKTSKQKFPFIICIRPRTDRDHRGLSNLDLPYSEIIVDKDSEHIVLERGYHEFPFAVPRWETATGEVYGRSPGMVALPDARTLQAMGKTLLVAGQKAVDPPLMALDDAIIGPARTFPGGITSIDAEAARGSGMFPVQPLNFGKNIPLGREMQNDTRQAVEAAFFRNIFNLPVEGPQMTATEILERKEEFIREIGPVFGRLESDYIGHIADRSFGILMRSGKFPEPPEILQNTDVEFEFQSPIQQARKQIEAVAASRAIEIAAPFIQADPSLMDNFDGDQIVRDMPEATGMPAKWLRSPDDRDAIRDARTQAQLQQAELQQAQQEADIAATSAQ